MDKIELIKEEIESYKESMKGLEPHSDFRRGQITAYNQIMQFIDSLPEEHNGDLEEEATRFVQTKEFCESTESPVLLIARHFAKWQKQKDQSTIELAEDHAMLAGMNKMKEEMMENAVEGVIDIRKWPAKAQIEFYDRLPVFNVRTGDKVKIIIVKPEQQ